MVDNNKYLGVVRTKRISELPDGTPVQTTDLLPVTRGTSNVRVNLGSMAAEDTSSYLSVLNNLSDLNSTATARQNLKVDGFVSIAYYKTSSNSWNDALLLALADNKHVFLPDLPSGQYYEFGDVVVPSNRTIFGFAQLLQFSPATTYTKDSQPAIKKKDGSSYIFSTVGSDHITFSGLYLDGVDYSVDGIVAGGDDVVLQNVSITKCRNGYGSESGVGKTTYISNCRIGDCYYGLKNLVDTMVMGGSIHDCRYDLVYLGSGASSNQFVCRLEGAGNWNGDGFGTYSLNHDSWSVRMISCSNNLFFCQSDYGRAGAYYMDDVGDVIIDGWIRRPGRATSVELAGAIGSTAYYTNNVRRVELRATVIKDNLDGGTGTITPDYVLTLGSTENKDLTVATNSWGNAFEVAPYTGSITKRVFFTGTGAPKRPQRSTGIAASGGTGSIQLVTQKNYDINGLSSGVLEINCRVSGTLYSAYFPYTIWNNAGTQTITFGTVFGEVGTAGAITIGGAGTIARLTVGSVSVVGSHVNVPFTITNQHATLTLDCYLNFNNSHYM